VALPVLLHADAEHEILRLEQQRRTFRRQRAGMFEEAGDADAPELATLVGFSRRRFLNSA